MATRLIVEKKQFTKEKIEECEQLTFHSNWLVFGIGVLSLLLTFRLSFRHNYGVRNLTFINNAFYSLTHQPHGVANNQCHEDSHWR